MKLEWLLRWSNYFSDRSGDRQQSGLTLKELISFNDLYNGKQVRFATNCYSVARGQFNCYIKDDRLSWEVAYYLRLK